MGKLEIKTDGQEDCIGCLTRLGLTPVEAGKYIGGVRSVQYARGETLMKQDSFATHLIYVHYGLVKLIIEGGKGKSFLVAIIGPGSFIGFPVLFGHEVFPFSAVPLTDTRACMIKCETMLAILNENKLATAYALQWFSADYTGSLRRFQVLTARNNHGRIADALLKLETITENGQSALSLLSRKELAEFAAVSQESLNKILNELKNDLIIQISDKGIALSRRDLLERLSRVG